MTSYCSLGQQQMSELFIILLLMETVNKYWHYSATTAGHTNSYNNRDNMPNTLGSTLFVIFAPTRYNFFLLLPTHMYSTP